MGKKWRSSARLTSEEDAPMLPTETEVSARSNGARRCGACGASLGPLSQDHVCDASLLDLLPNMAVQPGDSGSEGPGVRPGFGAGARAGWALGGDPGPFQPQLQRKQLQEQQQQQQQKQRRQAQSHLLEQPLNNHHHQRQPQRQRDSLLLSGTEDDDEEEPLRGSRGAPHRGASRVPPIDLERGREALAAQDEESLVFAKTHRVRTGGSSSDSGATASSSGRRTKRGRGGRTARGKAGAGLFDSTDSEENGRLLFSLANPHLSRKSIMAYRALGQSDDDDDDDDNGNSRGARRSGADAMERGRSRRKPSRRAGSMTARALAAMGLTPRAYPAPPEGADSGGNGEEEMHGFENGMQLGTQGKQRRKVRRLRKKRGPRKGSKGEVKVVVGGEMTESTSYESYSAYTSESSASSGVDDFILPKRSLCIRMWRGCRCTIERCAVITTLVTFLLGGGVALLYVWLRW